MSGAPVLWQYTFSHFNEKARWALDHKRIPHVRRSVLPGSPRAMRLSASGTLPVLDIDGERIVDSTRIIEALERRHPDPPLYPEGPEERARALGLEEFLDEEAGHELRRVAFYDWREDSAYASALLTAGQAPAVRRVFRAFLPVGMAYARRRYRIYPEDVEKGRRKVLEALDRVEAELESGDYLVGERFSVADLTAAALLFPLAWPDELQHALPDPPRWELREGVADRRAIEWVLEMYRRHRGSSAEIPAQATG